MRQTAVEWVFEYLWKNHHLAFSDNIFNQAKQMEKQQIVDAYGQGTADEAGEILDATKDAQQYYNKTYGK
jgi:hypothetical protein